ncbi:MAG TPA: toll/interleukin-1 receptor domain-containing protein [Alphaproteobacteria bacterium]|nr:toll/interleukin-1 receptor domain-containing protein [Alphaproteobacteria bacterium]
MPDVFLSYAKEDEKLALSTHAIFEAHGLSAFMAKTSLAPGALWADKILSALRSSPLVLCFVSKAACASPYVQQESGIAIEGQKTIVPIVWDMDPAELPGWLRKYQAFDLRAFCPEEYAAKLNEFAGRIRAKKDTTRLWLVSALLLLVVILLYIQARQA